MLTKTYSARSSALLLTMVGRPLVVAITASLACYYSTRRIATNDFPSATAGADAAFSKPSSPATASFTSNSTRALSGGAGERSANDFSHHPKAIRGITHGVVTDIFVDQVAANPNIEDSYAIEPVVTQQSRSDGSLFAVVDGHSGSACSIFVKKNLLHLLQWFHSKGWTSHLIDKAPFIEADQHFMNTCEDEQRWSQGLSGACVNVVHISSEGVVSCANVGDCRALIGRRRTSRVELSPAEQHGLTSNPLHVPVRLSYDHQLTNPRERERLLREHPDEEDIIRRYRVKSRLEPTRAMGDAGYKRHSFYAHKVSTQGEQYRSKKWTPPYVIADPDITRLQLTNEDDFMVIACDGLFQDMNDEEVVECVSDWLIKTKQTPNSVQHEKGSTKRWLHLPFFSSRASKVRGGESNPSQLLVDRALLRASQMQIGKKAVDEENLQWIQKVPSARRRSVHDDLTVMVVLLQPATQSKSPDSRTNSFSYALTVPPAFVGKLQYS